MMRLILLLSALLSAFAAGVSPSRAAEVSAAQVSALVERQAQAAVVASGLRPLAGLPRISDVLVAQFVELAPVTAVPLYAGRLRT